MRLIGQDEELQTAIRAELTRRTGGREDTGRSEAARLRKRSELETKRRKLLELYYSDNIPADLFKEEQDRITTRLAALKDTYEQSTLEQDDLAQQFEQVAEIPSDIDLDQLWAAATDTERKALLDEYITGVDVHADHLEVEVRGAPKLNVALHEVGLRNRSVENTGVGGGT